jgi:sRNA-binding protein
MASNQASMARRQRERARMQQAQEKLAKRQERREQKKTPSTHGSNPLDDPTIDWSEAVREIKIPTLPDETPPVEDEPT